MADTCTTATIASLSALSRICDVSRETIRKRIAQDGIKPSGEHRGAALYSIRAVVLAVCGEQAAAKSDDGGPDPESLPPSARKAWYESESRRLELAKQKGLLVLAEDARRGYSEVFAACSQFVAGIPDVLERDMTMPAEYVERAHELCRRERQRFADELVAKTIAKCAPNESRESTDGQAVDLSEKAHPARVQPQVTKTTAAGEAPPNNDSTVGGSVIRPQRGGPGTPLGPPLCEGPPP